MGKIVLQLNAKRARGLKKLAELWGVNEETALLRLLDKVIEESL